MLKTKLMLSKENQKEIIGIDLAKKSLQAHIQRLDITKNFDNSPKGFKALIKWLKAHQLDRGSLLFLMEYTGRHHYRICVFLESQGCDVAIVSPLEINKTLGVQRGKSDPIDAKRICEYGYRHYDKLKVYKLPNQSLIKLKTLRTTEKKMTKDLTGYKTTLEELKATDIGDISESVKVIKKQIKHLKKLINQLQDCINQIMKQDVELSQNFKLLNSIKGIGPKTALLVLVVTENFTKFNNARQLSCYSGIAPFPYQSGTSINGRNRVNHLANKEMKQMLYMCAMNALRFDAELKKYYDRKKEEGKASMSVINAVKNKLVARMFAIVKRQTPYVEIYKNVA